MTTKADLDAIDQAFIPAMTRFLVETPQTTFWIEGDSGLEGVPFGVVVGDLNEPPATPEALGQRIIERAVRALDDPLKLDDDQARRWLMERIQEA